MLLFRIHVSGAEPAHAPNATNEKPTADFAGCVGPESCRRCHPVEYQRWTQSAHGLAERPFHPETDAAAFEPPRSFPHGADSTTVRSLDHRFQILTLGLESNCQPFQVERVIGNAPLIQFLTPFPGGRYQVQEAACDPRSNQWFYVYGDKLRFPGEFGHWTGRGMNWNSQCADCHNTRLKKNYDAATDSYHTTMAGLGVGCEACHGPLQKHLDWQQAHPQAAGPDPTVAPLSPARTLEMCASCHARSTGLTGDFTPGDSFYDHYSLEILDAARHWYPDGQIKDEDCEFTSFLGSKMYQAGVTCLDCHPRDVTKPQLKGNDLCLRCHQGGYPQAPVIDPAAHGHHSLTDRGGDCVGCHLPVTVYMQRHPRHDHGFTLPDPLLTKQLAIPNACNRCHADKTTDWALNQVESWYGAKMNRPTRTRTQWMAAAENGDPQARQPLLDLLADPNQSPYWQAVAVHFLGQWAADPATRAALLQQLKHPHPLVRARAAQSLEPALTDPEVAAALQTTLTDPVRSVRLAAARTLRATLDLHSPAGREFQQALDVAADQPTGQFKAARFLLARGRVTAALPHLEQAAAGDPISPPYQCVRAQVLDQLGQTARALDILTRETAAVPDDPQTAYVLAAILARHGRNEAARTAANRALAIQHDFRPALDLLRTLPATPPARPGPHP